MTNKEYFDDPLRWSIEQKEPRTPTQWLWCNLRYDLVELTKEELILLGIEV